VASLTLLASNDAPTDPITVTATPAANDIWLLVVGWNTNATGTQPTFGVSNNNGNVGAWTSVIRSDQDNNDAAGYRCGVQVWKAQASGSPSGSTTVTADQDILLLGVRARLYKVTDPAPFGGVTAQAAADGTNSAGKLNDSAGRTYALASAPAASSALFTWTSVNDDDAAPDTMATPSGWTELEDVGGNPRFQALTRTGTTATTCFVNQVVAGYGQWGSVTIELASAGGPTHRLGYATAADLQFLALDPTGVVTARTDVGRLLWTAPVTGGTTNVSHAETAVGADGQTILVFLTSADTSAGVDGQAAFTSRTFAETAAGSDGQSAAVFVSSGETGAAGDGQGSARFTTITDTASGLEAHAVVVALSSPDTGVGSDGQSLNAGSTPISSSDTGVGVESQSVFVLVSVSDTGGGAEGQGSSTSRTLPETAVGVDAQALAAALVQAETAGVTDGQSVFVTFVTSDSGAGGEGQNVNVGGGVNISQAEIGLGVETEAVYVTVSSADAAVGTVFGFVKYGKNATILSTAFAPAVVRRVRRIPNGSRAFLERD
jgi:hypothetical protein